MQVVNNCSVVRIIKRLWTVVLLSPSRLVYLCPAVHRAAALGSLGLPPEVRSKKAWLAAIT
ncbi:hypothetical protein ARTHRO9V_160180 [Arthrobacter sp. 9V]|nr:hypothetical protein ARTHRO9V_160180 [Arthrobacter sp. 9V]